MTKQAAMASNYEVVSKGLGDQKLCFEVPIYRCNEDKYDDDMEKEKARYLRPLNRFREKAPRHWKYDHCGRTKRDLSLSLLLSSRR